MASMKPRGRSYEVRWRSGRKGDWQTCTFATEKLAQAAKDLAEARNHKISDTDVYAALLGIDRVDDEPDGEQREEVERSPTLAAWVGEWLTLKVDVAESTHKEYARMLRGRVVPILGDLKVDEIGRDKDIDPWKVNLASSAGRSI
ncbi:hypothetical protein ACWKSP_18075 [Micromonosporaceae bacterium Da 78-11]